MPESHQIKVKFHTYPPGWDLMGGPWLAAPLADITITGKIIACLECGSIVVPDLMGVHERFHQRSGGGDRDEETTDGV